MLERLPDSLVSIGLDAPTLLAFKVYSGLPTAGIWTEGDLQLQSLLLTAELIVDGLTSCPYRVRNYRDQFASNYRPPIPPYHRLPNYSPTTFLRYHFAIRNVQSGVSIFFNDGTTTTTYVEGTDFFVYNRTGLSPELAFVSTFVEPTYSLLPFPWTVLYSAGGGLDVEVAKTCIFELASFYYRNPEAQADANPSLGGIFQANLDYLKGSFL